jgi:hypothetical protein
MSGMRLGRQRRTRAILTELSRHIPVPWSIDTFTANLAASRQRPIQLLAWRFQSGDGLPSGAWIPTARADYIFYSCTATPTGRDQIIGHELGHLLLEHMPALGGAPAGLLQALAPALDPELASRFMTRTGYQAEQEAQAEEFGTRLVRLGVSKPRPGGPDELGRLTEALR